MINDYLQIWLILIIIILHCVISLLDICVGYGRYISEGELTYLGGEENAVHGEAASNWFNGCSMYTYVNWPLTHSDFERFNIVKGRSKLV